MAQQRNESLLVSRGDGSGERWTMKAWAVWTLRTAVVWDERERCSATW